LKLLDLLLRRTASRNHLPRTGLARPDVGHEASVREWLPIRVSGCASGSLLAAAVMALSSSLVGMRTVGRLETLDIMLYLSTIGAAQANDPAHITSVYKCHVVKNLGLRSFQLGHLRDFDWSEVTSKTPLFSQPSSLG
jgi:hypothetical protein